MSGAFHQAMLAEIGEVLGDFSLRDSENFLEMADAKRTTCKQMDDPQPRGIAETLVDLNQFHGRNMAFPLYSSIHIYLLTHTFNTNFLRADERQLSYKIAARNRYLDCTGAPRDIRSNFL
jgi:hypothetical protein